MEKITVIGIGKLGLGFALLLENAGYDVLGVDIFPNYVNSLNNKMYKTLEPEYEELLVNSRNFKASMSLQEGLEFSDLIFILVQTPNGGNDKFYDHSILSNLLENINKFKPKNKNIVIGCTVMPKYIDEIGKLLISDCENCYLSYNPEFVAQGEIIRGFRYPDIILVGTDNDNLHPILTELYTKITFSIPKFCFLKPIEAEIVKISNNGFITTKISFANMISDLCDNLKADKQKVLQTIGYDSRIGIKYFQPGYSFGGPCFPRDTKALKQLMDQNNIVSDILTATIKYNEEHIKFQTNQLLNENLDIYVIENVCYKNNSSIPIIEESAKLKIAKELVKAGKKVIINDKMNIINEVKKEFGNIFSYNIKKDILDNSLINKVYKYWNDNPCNIKHSDKLIGTKEYFEEVTKRKYFVEPHILNFVNFSKYRDKEVLEVGCGIGTAGQSFAENGANYTGIDLSDFSIELSKKRFEIFKLTGNFITCDIESINNIENKQFDLIYSFGVLHHTPNINKAISNIYSMLKPNGEFKLMLYAKNSFKYYEIINGLAQYEAQNNVPIANVYTNDEINELLKDFKNIKIDQDHIFPYKIDEYKKYKYVKKEYFQSIPSDIFRSMEKILGWHLCITCNK